MKNAGLASLFILLSYSFLFSQNNESYKLYKMESIYLKGNKYIKNDVIYPIGFFGENLREEMRISPHAIKEWNKYVNARNISLASSLTGLGMIIAAYSVENTNLTDGLIIGGLGLTVLSIPFSVKAGNQIRKSVWTRNRDLFQ